MGALLHERLSSRGSSAPIFYYVRREVEIVTEQEALEKARAQLRAEHASYMREWRKRNPGKERQSRERNRAKKILKEEKQNE